MELVKDEHILELNKKEFEIKLHHLKNYFKNISGFVGVNEVGDKYELVFNIPVTVEMEHDIYDLYNQINNLTFSDLVLTELTKTTGDSAEDFGKTLLSEFRGENIKMGITQAGFSGKVLSVLSERFDIENNGYPISLKDTIETGTLYEALSVLDFLISKCDNGDYNDLAPFITSERLTIFKQKILEYLQ